MRWRFWEADEPDDVPESEPVYEDDSGFYYRSLPRRGELHNQHTALLQETSGEITVYSENPLGSEEIDDTVRDLPKLINFYNQAVKGESKRRSLQIEYQETDQALQYLIRINPGDSEVNLTTEFSGSITGVEREYVEDYLSSLIDVDRYDLGWQFDLDGTVDEFVAADTVYEPSIDELRSALLAGQVRDVTWANTDMAYDQDDGERISRLFLNPTDPETVDGLLTETAITVEETVAHTGRSYTVTVEHPPGEPDIDGTLEISLFSTTPLFSGEQSGKERGRSPEKVLETV